MMPGQRGGKKKGMTVEFQGLLHMSYLLFLSLPALFSDMNLHRLPKKKIHTNSVRRILHADKELFLYMPACNFC